MARLSKYPRELRERAVRAVVESIGQGEYPSKFEAIRTIAGPLGIGTLETLRKWVRQAEVDGGERPGKSTQELAEIRELKKEVAELRRANKKWGKPCPAIPQLSRSAWEGVHPVPRLRRRDPKGAVLDTNAIESFNARYRRAVTTKGHFPTEQAALKTLHLVTRSLDRKGTGQAR